MRKIVSVQRGALFLLAIATGACGDRPPTVSGGCGEMGTAGGSVTGSVTASLDGCAQYTVSNDGGFKAFTTIAIYSGSVGKFTHRLVLAFSGLRPGPGTYAVGEDAHQLSGISNFKFDGGSSPDTEFQIMSGSMVITKSSTSELVGTVNFTAAVDRSYQQTVTISGNFSARCGSSSDIC